MSDNNTVPLQVNESFTINGIDAQAIVDDIHLTRNASGYDVAVLGKSGETRPNRPVAFEFKHRSFRRTVSVTLRSNERGIVSLGELAGIEYVRARYLDQEPKQWHLTDHRYSFPEVVHTLEGSELRFPYRDLGGLGADGMQLSLLEVQRDSYVEDFGDHLSIVNDTIVIDSLPPGDYQLNLLALQKTIQIHVTHGPARAGYGLSATRGLQLSHDRMMFVERLEHRDTTLTIECRERQRPNTSSRLRTAIRSGVLTVRPSEPCIFTCTVARGSRTRTIDLSARSTNR